MADKKPFFTVSGIVEAPQPQVAGLLMRAQPGPVGPDNALYLNPKGKGKGGKGWVLKGGPTSFRATIPGDMGGGMKYEIDPRTSTILTEGMWWFRGIFRIEPDPRGTRVVQEGYDIATKAKFLVPFIKRGFPKEQRKMVAGLLDQIGSRLGVKAYLD